MRENTKASAASFAELKIESLQSLVWGVSYHQTHYKLPKDTNKTLLHREKVGKTKKKSKIQRLQEISQGLRICEISKVAIASSTGSAFAFFWIGCSKLQLDSSCL